MRLFKVIAPVLLLTIFGIIICLSFTKYRSPVAIPQYQHVIVVVEENHNYDALIGSVNAPYINSLAQNGALFTDSHGVTHPSQANYIALFSGDVQGVKADECLTTVTPFTTPNLGAALIDKGFTFKGYAQTMP